jgi:hypothetical protein
MGFWSGLGKVFKVAAPIAASFIPGLGPIASTLVSAGTGAAAGAIGGGKKGALIGGLIGGLTGGAGSAAKGGATAANAAKQGIGSTIGNIAKKTAGGLIGNLLNPNVLETASSGVAGATQAAAHNRGVALDAMMQGDQNRIVARQDRRAEEADLWKKMQAADYIKSGGTPRPTSPTLSANGKPFTQFSFGPAPISEGNKAMASTLEGQLMDRLKNPLQLSDYESKMEPGTMEKIGNWTAPALDILSEIRRARGGNAQPTATATPTPMPTVPTVPINNGPLLQLPGVTAANPPKPQLNLDDDYDWSNR